MHNIKISILLFTCICFSLCGFAQSAGTISGRIETTHEKAGSVTAALIRTKDSSTVKLAATNKQGEYMFEQIANGKYRIMFTAVGFQRSVSEMVEINSQQQVVNMAPIALKPAAAKLANVTVTATRPLIEHHIDRTIVNVDASATNIGATALEILEKSPGVSVDREGSISLKGKQGVLVLVDGRPTQMAGDDLANLLRNMTFNQLDQIEIMTNPPARYDAAGNAGVINIKTKRMVNAGYNGNATISYMQGRYPRTNEGFNFNYRKQKLNVFTSLSHSFRKSFEDQLITRKVRNNSDVIQNYIEQQGDKLVNGNGFNGKLGLDFFADKKTTIGIAINGATNSFSTNTANNTNILNNAKVLQSITSAVVDNDATWNRFNSNLYFRRILNTKGRELTADIDFIQHHSSTQLHMVNAYPYVNGSGPAYPDTLQGHLPQHIKVYSGRIDYIHPLGKNAKFEAGIKSSIVRTDNNARYDSLQDGMLVRDVNRSNHFVYEENINAAYVNMVKPLGKKLNAQLGLRLENTNALGKQLTTNKNFDRHYTQLFPTAYLQYKLDDKNTLTANYGKRVQRPSYQSLNPFIRFLNRYTYSEGNPNLVPAISHNIELTHAFRNTIVTTINYTATNDIINSVVEQKGSEAFIRPANIASLRQVGLSISANNNITKWWSSNVNINVFHDNYKGVINNDPVDLSATSAILMMTQQFKLSKTLTAEVSGRYRTGWLEGVLRAEPIGFVWAGISKQVMKNQGSIRLTVRDIFYTQKFKGTGRYGNVDFNIQEINDTRVVILGFTYRFSKGKKLPPVKRTAGSANEEENRIEE